MKPIMAFVLLASGFFAANPAGASGALSDDALLNAPAKTEFKIHPEDIVLNTLGEVQKASDGAASTIQIAVGLGKTYDVPWCIEYPANGEEVRLPIKPIPAGQTLGDALKAITEQSRGAIQWDTLRGRAIVSFLPAEKTASTLLLDREVRLESNAATLGEALAALESAYNTQYKDIPLLISLDCSNAAPETPLEAPPNQALTNPVVLRDGLLQMLDMAGEYRATYGASVMRDPEDRLYVIIHVRRGECRDEFLAESEYLAVREQVAAQKKRLAGYFDPATAK